MAQNKKRFSLDMKYLVWFSCFTYVCGLLESPHPDNGRLSYTSVDSDVKRFEVTANFITLIQRSYHIFGTSLKNLAPLPIRVYFLLSFSKFINFMFSFFHFPFFSFVTKITVCNVVHTVNGFHTSPQMMIAMMFFFLHFCASKSQKIVKDV